MEASKDKRAGGCLNSLDQIVTIGRFVGFCDRAVSTSTTRNKAHDQESRPPMVARKNDCDAHASVTLCRGDN